MTGISREEHFWSLCRHIHTTKAKHAQRRQCICCKAELTYGRVCGACMERIKKSGALALKAPAKIVWDDDRMQGRSR